MIIMTHESKSTQAADRIEELLIAGKQIVQDIREIDMMYPTGHQRAYGRVYWLRRELSRVVVALGGVGVPPDLEKLANHYEAQIK